MSCSIVSARDVQWSKLMGESGRVLAGGVWAAWLRICEAVCGCLRRGSAFGRTGDEVFRDVNGWAGSGIASAANRGRVDGRGGFSWVLRF
jgi:hypothetical protein